MYELSFFLPLAVVTGLNFFFFLDMHVSNSSVLFFLKLNVQLPETWTEPTAFLICFVSIGDLAFNIADWFWQ